MMCFLSRNEETALCAARQAKEICLKALKDASSTDEEIRRTVEASFQNLFDILQASSPSTIEFLDGNSPGAQRARQLLLGLPADVEVSWHVFLDYRLGSDIDPAERAKLEPIAQAAWKTKRFMKAFIQLLRERTTIHLKKEHHQHYHYFVRGNFGLTDNMIRALYGLHRFTGIRKLSLLDVGIDHSMLSKIITCCIELTVLKRREHLARVRHFVEPALAREAFSLITLGTNESLRENKYGNISGNLGIPAVVARQSVAATPPGTSLTAHPASAPYTMTKHSATAPPPDNANTAEAPPAANTHLAAAPSTTVTNHSKASSATLTTAECHAVPPPTITTHPGAASLSVNAHPAAPQLVGDVLHPSAATLPPAPVVPMDSLVGRRVAREFDEGLFFGTIRQYLPRGTVEDADFEMWAVEYDDGDEADYDHVNIQAMIALYEMQTMCNEETASQQPKAVDAATATNDAAFENGKKRAATNNYHTTHAAKFAKLVDGSNK